MAENSKAAPYADAFEVLAREAETIGAGRPPEAVLMAARGIWHLARPDGTSPLGGHGLTEGDCLHFARHALDAALASTAGAGAGDWVTVPKVPTPAMNEAGWEASLGYPGPMIPDFVEINANIYRAMIEAAPAVPASPRSGAGEGEEQLAEDLCDALRKATGLVSGSDAERFWIKVCFDGLDTAHLTLTLLSQIVATSQGGGAGRSERAVEIRELSKLADDFDRSGKTLICPEQYPPGYVQGWEEAHRYCARDLRTLAESLAGQSEKGEGEGRVPAASYEMRKAFHRVRSIANHIGTAPSEAQLDELSDAVDTFHLQFVRTAPAQSPSTSDREG